MWGYPCFRDGALAVVVLFTDAPWHEGAPDPSTLGDFYSTYSGINPAPHDFEQMVQAYQRHGARQVFVNASTTARCEGAVYTDHGTPDTVGPCYDMRASAERTGSVDIDGNPLLFDLPPSGGVSQDFVRVVTNAIQTLATRVPIDIDTAVRNDPANPGGIDARAFVQRRTPSCQVQNNAQGCWTEPAGFAHAAAVARTDASSFYRVIPGTRVRFTLYFQNASVFGGSSDNITLFHAFIDVRAGGAALLDTREVFIVVPVRQIIAG
jgi:hypothetical protein